MSDELYALLTERRHASSQLFKDWTLEKFRRNQERARNGGATR